MRGESPTGRQSGVPLRFPRPVIPVIAAGLAAVWVAASSAPALADQVRQQEFWLSQLSVSQAWLVTQGSGVTVAVLSDGVDTQQPDLGGSVTTGPDYTGTGQESGSFFGAQGTAAASLIAGRGTGAGGNSGIIGIAPRARILSVRVTLDPDDPALDSSAAGAVLPGAIASGIRYAVAHGASVIDLPLDPGRPNPTAIAALPIPRFSTQAPQLNGIIAAEGGSVAEQQAVAYAISQGVVLVAPAGDNALGTDAANFPAAYPHVISVGAFDSSFNLGAFSSNQPYVTVTAPGVGVTAADAAGGYTSVSSTAAASAIVSGIAALIKAQFPHLTPAQVSQALSTSTVVRPPGGQAAGSGTGSVDAGRAMLAAATLAAPASARAGAQAEPLISPAAPVVARVASSLTPRLVRAAVISLGVLILLLAAIWWYSRAGRRHERHRAQATAQWAPSSQDAFSPYGPGDDRTEADRMLEYFTAPSSHPVAVSSPFGARRGVLTTSRDRAGREAPGAPGAQGAWSSDAPPPRAPSRHARVSGTPPWEPASQPASELPWAAIPGPAGGGRAAARHAGGPGTDSVWPSSPAAPASASSQSWEELAASVTAAARPAEPAPLPAADTVRAGDAGGRRVAGGRLAAGRPGPGRPGPSRRNRAPGPPAPVTLGVELGGRRAGRVGRGRLAAIAGRRCLPGGSGRRGRLGAGRPMAARPGRTVAGGRRCRTGAGGRRCRTGAAAGGRDRVVAARRAGRGECAAVARGRECHGVARARGNRIVADGRRVPAGRGAGRGAARPGQRRRAAVHLAARPALRASPARGRERVLSRPGQPLRAARSAASSSLRTDAYMGTYSCPDSFWMAWITSSVTTRRCWARRPGARRRSAAPPPGSRSGPAGESGARAAGSAPCRSWPPG